MRPSRVMHITSVAEIEGIGVVAVSAMFEDLNVWTFEIEPEAVAAMALGLLSCCNSKAGATFTVKPPIPVATARQGFGQMLDLVLRAPAAPAGVKEEMPRG